MEEEQRKIAKMPGDAVQWWTNDQTFFNEVLHRAPTPVGIRPKSVRAAEREAAAREMRLHLRQPRRLAQLNETLTQISAALRDNSTAELELLRGLEFKLASCKKGCFGTSAPSQTFSVTTFPMLCFASGHTFFTQSLQDRLGFRPVAVHTTFQFGDT